MNDLISRQAAIDAADKIIERDTSGNNDVVKAMTAWKTYVEGLPSVHPEIIRCGQCKYAEVADPDDSQDGYTCQFHRGSIWFSGSYCSWGERKTDGEIIPE